MPSKPDAGPVYPGAKYGDAPLVFRNKTGPSLIHLTL
jgi:hypothetical protein